MDDRGECGGPGIIDLQPRATAANRTAPLTNLRAEVVEIRTGSVVDSRSAKVATHRVRQGPIPVHRRQGHPPAPGISLPHARASEHRALTWRGSVSMGRPFRV
jgi:hypothetical protein